MDHSSAHCPHIGIGPKKLAKFFFPDSVIWARSTHNNNPETDHHGERQPTPHDRHPSPRCKLAAASSERGSLTPMHAGRHYVEFEALALRSFSDASLTGFVAGPSVGIGVVN